MQQNASNKNVKKCLSRVCMFLQQVYSYMPKKAGTKKDTIFGHCNITFLNTYEAT